MPELNLTVEPDVLTSSHGVELALRHWGGDGPPMLVSHATGFNATTYRPLIPAFAQHFDVWGIDHRAHGDSTPPDDDSGFDWWNVAEDVALVVEHIGESVVGFGHSMGGAALLMAEARHAGTVTAAYVYEPIIFPGGFKPQNSPLSMGARKRREVFDSKADALARYASRPPLGMLRADALAAYVDGGFTEQPDGTVILSCRGEHEAQTFDHSGTPLSDISHISSRVLVAAGMDNPDAEKPGDWSEGIAAALANGSYLAYDQFGHFGPLQRPDTIARDAIAFLTG